MNELLKNKLELLEDPQMRERYALGFLQELTLQLMERKMFLKKLHLAGGVALRLMGRFHWTCRALDFIPAKPKGFDLGSALRAIQQELQGQGYQVSFTISQSLTGTRAKLNFAELLPGMPRDQAMITLELRLLDLPLKGAEFATLVANRHFLFQVKTLRPSSLFSFQLARLFLEKKPDAMDYFALLWFLEQKTEVNYKLLANLLGQPGAKPEPWDKEKLRQRLVALLRKTDFVDLEEEAKRCLDNRAESEYFQLDYFEYQTEQYFSPF